MVWPLKKSRRQSQSPSSVGSASSPPRRHRAFFASRHKRRITQKDSNITMLTECSNSSGSDKTISAPWRVGKFSPLVLVSSYSAKYSKYSRVAVNEPQKTIFAPPHLKVMNGGPKSQQVTAKTTVMGKVQRQS